MHDKTLSYQTQLDTKASCFSIDYNWDISVCSVNWNPCNNEAKLYLTSVF